MLTAIYSETPFNDAKRLDRLLASYAVHSYMPIRPLFGRWDQDRIDSHGSIAPRIPSYACNGNTRHALVTSLCHQGAKLDFIALPLNRPSLSAVSAQRQLVVRCNLLDQRACWNGESEG